MLSQRLESSAPDVTYRLSLSDVGLAEICGFAERLRLVGAVESHDLDGSHHLGSVAVGNAEQPAAHLMQIRNLQQLLQPVEICRLFNQRQPLPARRTRSRAIALQSGLPPLAHVLRQLPDGSHKIRIPQLGSPCVDEHAEIGPELDHPLVARPSDGRRCIVHSKGVGVDGKPNDHGA